MLHSRCLIPSLRYRDSDFSTEVTKLQSSYQEAEPTTDANANPEIVTRSLVNRLEKSIGELEEEKKQWATERDELGRELAVAECKVEELMGPSGIRKSICSRRRNERLISRFGCCT